MYKHQKYAIISQLNQINDQLSKDKDDNVSYVATHITNAIIRLRQSIKRGDE